MKKYVLCLTIVCLVLAFALSLAGCKPKTIATPADLEYDGALLFWSPVEGAEGYQVQLNGDICADVKQAHYAVSVQQGTFAVRATNSKGLTSEWSAPLTYSGKSDRPQALTTPTVLEVDGEGLLRWTPVVGAVSYRVWVNADLYTTVETPYCTLVLSGSGYRTVQVSAVAGEGRSDSARSASYRIELADGRVVAPKLTSPSVSFEPSTRCLSWSAVRNATGYAVYATSPSWGDNRRLMATLDADSAKASYRYTVNPQEGGATYRVVALGDGIKYANSADSNALSFPLAAASAPRHLHLAVIDGVVQLCWDAIANVNGYELRLEREGESRLIGSDTPNVRLRADGTWSVCVRGLGDDKIYRSTVYSEQIVVTVEGGDIAPLPLDSPKGLYVKDNVIYWDAVPYASGYQITIDTPADDQVGTYNLSSNGNRLDLDSHLWDSVLEIYVRALPTAGYAASLWGEGYIQVPQEEDEEGRPLPPAYTYLAPPSPLVYDGERFAWSEVSGASGYLLIVNDHPYEVEGTRLDLANPGAVTAKVRALSAEERVLSSAWSAEYTFVYPLSLSAPTGLSSKGEILSWNVVDGATGYVVRVGSLRIDTPANTLNLSTYLPYDGNYDLAVKAVGDGYADSPYSEWYVFVADYEEEGTEHKPYAISSADDLPLLARYPGAYFALTDDLVLDEAESLFDYNVPFAGSIDGRGHVITVHTIKGTATSSGLFGYLSGATLTDVDFVFDQVVAGGYRVGGILAAYATDCTLAGVSIAVSAQTSHGVVGIATGSAFRDVMADVRLTGTGGYLGLVGQATSCRFEGIEVKGSLAGGSYTLVGGVAAMAVDCDFEGVTIGSKDEPFVLSGNVNTGAIVGSGDGSITQAVVWATLTGRGNLGSSGTFTGDFDGQVQLSVTLTDDGSVGGVAGHGGGKASGDFSLTVEGEASNAYIGTAWGVSDNAIVEGTPAFDLTVDARLSLGYVGGVVGLGQCAYSGVTHGFITVANGVRIGKISGLVEETDQYWQINEEVSG